MSDEIILTLRAAPKAMVDASSLDFHRWGELASSEVARLRLRAEGAGLVPLGDLFTVKGERARRIRVVGDLFMVENLGTGFDAGELLIDGNAGARVGARMKGGRITVTGNAGWGAGLEMAGGTLDVGGSVGPRAGGAPLGAKRGMTGGELIVRGSAGPEAASSMRRGLVTVAGDAGEGVGRATIAGTVVVFGSVGPNPGQWSKRGTVVALGSVTPPPTYRYACTYRPEYLGLLLRRLKDLRLPVTDEHLTGSYRRYSGDLAELGAGEILAWTRN